MVATYLQNTKMEFTLSVGARLHPLVGFWWRDKLERLGSRRVVHREREVVPVNNNGKVVPGFTGERGGE